MIERPILFSGPMVKAILAGRKTQTRRLIRGEVMSGFGGGPVGSTPYGARGDRLWVRETWCPLDLDYGATISRRQRLPRDRGHIIPSYRADHVDPKGDGPGNPMPWRPSIFMPRWASRLTLEITDVRAERLQDISGEDAAAEGIQEPRCGCEACSHSATMCPADAGAHVESFAHLWDSINGKRAPWATNPWVWAVSFRSCSAATSPRKDDCP